MWKVKCLVPRPENWWLIFIVILSLHIIHQFSHRFPAVLSTVRMVANVSQSTTVALSLQGASVLPASVELSVRLELHQYPLSHVNKPLRGKVRPQPITTSSSGRWNLSKLRGKVRLPIISSSISGSQLAVNKARGRTEFITNSSSGGNDDDVWRWSTYEIKAVELEL